VAKSFSITKRAVWDAWKAVKSNKGSAGVDGQSIEDFESDLINNLYKIWSRLSSGSYFPPPVRRVEIPKSKGKLRPLGIPTVSDRVAQTVIRNVLNPLWTHTSMMIHIGIERVNRRLMRYLKPELGAGVMTGCWIWISKVSLMP